MQNDYELYIDHVIAEMRRSLERNKIKMCQEMLRDYPLLNSETAFKIKIRSPSTDNILILIAMQKEFLRRRGLSTVGPWYV